MERRRIAIVGAGVSGLAAAHLLHPRHDVTVFEAEPRPGGHAHTVGTDDGQHVDMGFIVLNDRNYPTFNRLLSRLGVPTQVSDMSMSVSTEDGSFEYASTSLGGLLARPANAADPSFWRMIRDVRRFQRRATELLAPDADPRISLGDYLERNRYSRAFIDRLLVPQASAVWSADPKQMWEFPARFLVRFFHNHGMLTLTDRPTWHTIPGGSQTYVEKLVAPLTVHTKAPVVRVARDADGVDVHPAGHEALRFDDVVLACHADQTLKLLADPSDDERRILGAFPYQPNEVVLHTDASLLPRRRRARASWVYHLLDEPTNRSTVSYHMNRLQALRTDEQIVVTLNRTEAIDPAKIVAVRQWAHPVFTAEGMAAQERHAEISGARRTHYAGAYWRWGFHEDGVWSGLRAAAAVGAARPALEVAA
jgi:predicted NAD/FAD-binding protein